MLQILEMITGECTPTKTYAQRRWVFVPADSSHPDWDGSYGHLKIVMQKTGGGFAKAETFRYLVEEQYNHGKPGRVFILVKQDDPNAESPYECFVADDERLANCTCKAGKCRVPDCKHDAVLRGVIEQGGFDR